MFMKRQRREELIPSARPSPYPGEPSIGLAKEQLLGKATDYYCKVRDFQIFNSEALRFRGLGTPPRVSLPPYLPVVVVLLLPLPSPFFSPSLPPSFSLHSMLESVLKTLFPYWC